MAAVDRIADGVRAVGSTLLGNPAELAVLFGPTASATLHRSRRGAGPAVADLRRGGTSLRGWPDVRKLLGGPGLHWVSVKPAHGSSASGALAIESAPGGRLHATTWSNELPPER